MVTFKVWLQRARRSGAGADELGGAFPGDRGGGGDRDEGAAGVAVPAGGGGLGHDEAERIRRGQ